MWAQQVHVFLIHLFSSRINFRVDWGKLTFSVWILIYYFDFVALPISAYKACNKFVISRTFGFVVHLYPQILQKLVFNEKNESIVQYIYIVGKGAGCNQTEIKFNWPSFENGTKSEDRKVILRLFGHMNVPYSLIVSKHFFL